MTPLGLIRSATRAALRRRYGYAALRIVRRGVRRALREHRARQVDAAAPYSISTARVVEAHFAAMRRLRKRWPKLNPCDVRAEP
jgi:hypothetical protein